MPMPMRGKLTERLFAQGLLTPAMLEELKKEWESAESASRYSTDIDSDDDPSPLRKAPRRIKRIIKK
jgi:hypothetical protein